MSNVASAVIPGIRITATWRLASTWIAAAIVAVPLGVLLHELGHFVAYLAFGFDGVALHYSSATHAIERTFWQQVYRGNVAAAASMIPLWKAGIATAAGILVSCALTFVCCLWARKSPQPLAIALGIFAPFRFLSGISTIPALLSGRPIRVGSDEAHLAALTGIPLIVLIFAGLLFVVLAWILLIRSIPKDHRLISLGSLVAGLAIGVFLYFSVIGALLLP